MNKITASVVLLVLPAAWAKPIDLQMGARSYGMGGAFTAIADDGTASYWNPAGQTQVKGMTLSETNWILADVSDVNVNYVAMTMPIASVGTVSGGWLLQHATLEQGDGATYQQNDYNEHSFRLAFARELWERLWIFQHTSIGFSLNRDMIDVDQGSGAGTGFDLGVWTAFPHGFRLGLVGKSLATDMMGDKVSPEYRLGLAWTLPNPRHLLTLSADVMTKDDVEYVDDVNGMKTAYKVFEGAEYRHVSGDWDFSIRGGSNTVVGSYRGAFDWSLGAGVGFSGVRLDYAYQNSSDDVRSLGQTHRISIEVDIDKLRSLSRTSPVDAPKSVEPQAPKHVPAATAPVTEEKSTPAAKPASTPGQNSISVAPKPAPAPSPASTQERTAPTVTQKPTPATTAPVHEAPSSQTQESNPKK